MTVRFEQPEWLLALVVALAVTAVGARWMLAMSPFRRWVSVLVRLALMAIIVAMLARGATVRKTDTFAVVGVVDVSGSVRRFAKVESAGGVQVPATDAAMAFLKEATRGRGPEDLVGLVAFDGRATAIALPSHADVLSRDLDVAPEDGTNIERALDLARSLIPPDAAGRIVLFSDGDQTSGDGVASAGACRTARVPVDVVAFSYRVGTDVAVESIDAPPTADPGSTVLVRVVLSATGPAKGTLHLLSEGHAIDLNGALPGTGRGVTLHEGLNVERVELRLDQGRVHRLRAVFEPDITGPGGGDAIAENNTAESFTITPGKGAVLLVDGVSQGDPGGPGATLADVLRRGGLDVRVVAPGGIPGDAVSLQAYDSVILQNVPADEVPMGTQEQLATAVREIGTGLVMIGGPASFGAGGWKGSAIEPILPVRLDLSNKVVVPDVAIVLVIDHSGSMHRPVLGTGRTQQEIANDAAALAIRSLDRTDMLGVIEFNHEASEVIPISRNSDPAANVDRVRGIVADGGTNMVPALRMAADQMAKVDPKIKVRHVIVLTDGVSRDRPQVLPAVKTLADMGVRVSTIAVGDEPDAKSLEAAAKLGSGVFYHADSATQLPRILLKAVRLTRTPMVREEPFRPVVLPVGSPYTLGIVNPPELGGLTLTRPREEPTAITAMVTPGGEPLLAHWNVGLGQVVAFTSDASEWAGGWIGSGLYERFWLQTIRRVARPTDLGLASGAMEIGAGKVTVRVGARAKGGGTLDGLDIGATVYPPSGEPQELRLSQVGPGVYEGSVPAGPSGSYLAIVKPGKNNPGIAPLVVGASVQGGIEFRARENNEALMRGISAASGGRVLSLSDPRGAKLFDRGGIPAREALSPLWPVLLVWSLVLLLVDIATRRIAWDRWVSALFRARAEPSAAHAGVPGAARLRVARADAERDGSLTLSEADAARLREAARDRRRAERLAAMGGGAAGVQPRPEHEGVATDTDPLLAAKRRVRGQLDEGSDAQ